MPNEKKVLMSNVSGKTVYFAEVSETMRSYKENLVKELEHYGCIIKEVPDARQDIENAREIIEKCEISIHILSDNDQIIQSADRGLEEQQVIYSVQHYLSQKLLSEAVENRLKIFAWHPKSSSNNMFEEERIPNHLQRIQQYDEVELLRTNFERFKHHLLNKIEADTTETVDEFYIKGDNNVCIYFQYDNIDKEKALEYIDYLRKRGFTVFTPIFDGDIIEIRKMHNSFLKKFDIAVIFAIEASVNWVNMKIMDILKSPGLGREKKIMGKAVFTSEQKGKELTLIQGGFDFIPLDQNSLKDQIGGFLKKINY